MAEGSLLSGAPGVDGQTVAEYGEHLEENLRSLLERAKSGTYYAPPVKRVHIPKDNGETRPIGMPTTEDKVLQRAVAMILEPIYEEEFYDFSYGFRPGRSPHQALEQFWKEAMGLGVSWVLEVDLRKYFDSVNRSKLLELLGERMGDGVLLRLVSKWLHAGADERQSLRGAVSRLTVRRPEFRRGDVGELVEGSGGDFRGLVNRGGDERVAENVGARRTVEGGAFFQIDLHIGPETRISSLLVVLDGVLVLRSVDYPQIFQNSARLRTFPGAKEIWDGDCREEGNDGHDDHDFHESEAPAAVLANMKVGIIITCFHGRFLVNGSVLIKSYGNITEL